MSAPTSETVFAALFALLQGAYPWATSSRRLKLWDEPGLVDNMPCLFQYEGDQDDYEWQDDLMLRRTLKCRLFSYINAKDPTVIGATAINAIRDAITAALAPSSFTDLTTNRQTLSGLVSSCRIIGPVFKEPGDIDGIGVVVIPILIVWP